MKLTDVKTVAVIGAGTMGHGIALAYARYGYPVFLNDLNGDVLDRALVHVREALMTFAAEGLIPEADIEKTLANITPTTDLAAAVREADFVIEALWEDLALKQELFPRMEALCPPGAILASNTSALLLDDIVVHCQRPEQIIITHWVNPPHLVPVVEVLGNAKTSPETFALTEALLERINKIAVRVSRPVPGFIVNRLQAAMMREVWSLWEQGVASAEDLDRVMRAGLGFRWAALGPMETADLGGLDVFCKVMDGLFKEISADREAPAAIKKMVAEGKLGLKSGQGFFDYKDPAATVRERDRKHIQLLKLWYS